MMMMMILRRIIYTVSTDRWYYQRIEMAVQDILTTVLLKIATMCDFIGSLHWLNNKKHSGSCFEVCNYLYIYIDIISNIWMNINIHIHIHVYNHIIIYIYTCIEFICAWHISGFSIQRNGAQQQCPCANIRVPLKSTGEKERYHSFWLVVGLNPSEKYFCSSIGMMIIPNIGKIKLMFQTTNLV